ncbi:AAA family ATPase [Dactylosporangium sp. NPDC049525]|uniref:AAA family ATPase n=1 Tax=Dactylosporangium sp. NPDC049525 TaxID=3154730 RepID=UPI003440604F
MTTDHAETVDELILAHLDTVSLPASTSDLLYGALLGEDDFAAVLGGATSTRPARAADATAAAEPIGTYLSSIEVAGFRGIGAPATLSLTPAPGLTIVTGRNGSGKSSFAEAAEFAVTGDNRRWSQRGSVWQDGWRNLHATEDPRIRVRLGVESHRNGATVECHWTGPAALADGTAFLQLAGRPRQSVEELGWAAPLELYRPFLSYAELGGLLSGKPSEMHDSLQRILGLQRLVELEKRLKDARKQMDDRRKVAAAELPGLRAVLAEHPDPRAREAERLLAAQVPELDLLDELGAAGEPVDDATWGPLRQLDVLELPRRDDLAAEVERLRGALHRIEDLAGTPAAEARSLAGLLRDALQHRQDHPDQPCPVCGGRILDEAWAARARAELERLTERAERLDAAHRDVAASRTALRTGIVALPGVLRLDLGVPGVDTADARAAWQRWDELLGSGDAARIAGGALASFDALDAALQPVVTAARQALEGRRQAWSPAADRIRAWTDTARGSRHAAAMYAALQKAVTWLRGVGERIRNDKLEPVAKEATEIWNMLRQESNVELGGIRLAGTGTTRRVDLDVTVDGAPGAALGVMSQGELHALALALFLPRATMAESPFRFLVIDDPVQSMDPVKVYGLAQVLDRVAAHRQVIVFTHDDRLPAAVRHLGLKARILTVSRLARSQVVISSDRDGNPAWRYLDDARAVANDTELDDAVRGPIVCNLIRDALEYTCQEVIRTRDHREGTPVADTEAALNNVQGLRSTLILALLPGGDRSGEYQDSLRRLHPAAPKVVAAANSGAHGDHRGTSLLGLVNDAEQVIGKLRPA